SRDNRAGQSQPRSCKRLGNRQRRSAIQANHACEVSRSHLIGRRDGEQRQNFAQHRLDGGDEREARTPELAIASCSAYRLLWSSWSRGSRTSIETSPVMSDAPVVPNT